MYNMYLAQPFSKGTQLDLDELKVIEGDELSLYKVHGELFENFVNSYWCLKLWRIMFIVLKY